jgi:hypothetical protein
MHPSITESHYVEYAGLITSAYAIDTIPSCVIVFHCHHQSLYWRRIWLGQTSIDGYKAMRVDVTNLTQDEEQSLFTIKTDMPILM